MAMGMLIKSWFKYVTVWLKVNDRETVDVFATEKCQLIQRLLDW